MSRRPMSRWFTSHRRTALVQADSRQIRPLHGTPQAPRPRRREPRLPSTVSDLFGAAEVAWLGVVPWGTPPPTKAPGVYVVADSRERNGLAAPPACCPISAAAIDELLTARPELGVDGRRPSAAELAARIEAMWLPDETVRYVGLATSLYKRVGQYYRTPLGAKSPHAGGWALKCLGDLTAMWVHYGVCEAAAVRGAEQRMQRAFMIQTSERSRSGVIDSDLPLPHANLEYRADGRRWVKRHGITGATGPRR